MPNFKTAAMSAVISSALLVTACGGGSSSGSSTPTASSVGYDGVTTAVKLSSTVASSVAKETASSMLNMDLGSTTSGLMNKAGDGSANHAGLGQFTSGLIDFSLSKASASSSAMLSGVTQTQTTACDASGTVTMTVTVADANSQTLSAGDSISSTFNNCSMDGTTTLSGGFKFVVNSFSTTSTSYKITFSNMKMAQASGDYSLINGGFTMAMSTASGTSYSMSGDALLTEDSTGGSVSQEALTKFSLSDSEDLSYNFTADRDYTYYSSFNGVTDGYIEIDTTTPVFLYYGDSYPSSGVIVLTGADDASIKLTIVDNTQFTIAYDLDGDGVYGNNSDPATETVAWTAI